MKWFIIEDGRGQILITLLGYGVTLSDFFIGVSVGLVHAYKEVYIPNDCTHVRTTNLTLTRREKK